MRVFRLCKPNFETLDGEGARIYGGRWNYKGYPIVYTSTHLSLAVLELLVHTSTDLIPADLISLEIEIPDSVLTRTIDLPQRWQETKDDSLLQKIGTEWLKEQSSAVLIVPSIIITSEQNVLINPIHSDASQIKVQQKQLFQLDSRLF